MNSSAAASCPSPSRVYEGHSSVLVHWCDTTHKWHVSSHRFILTKTPQGLIGQFVSSDWFGTYIYSGKTFLVITMPKNDSLENLTDELNKGDMESKYLKQYNINMFMCYDIEQYEKSVKKDDSIRINLKSSNNKKSLSLSVRKSQSRIYGYLPSFYFVD